MSAAIAAGLGLAEQVLVYVNTKNARELIVKVRDTRLAILAEEGKGYYSDDAKLETLYAQAKIHMEAAEAELRLKSA